MKSNRLSEFFKWVLLSVLVGFGMFAFLMLIGEETPDNPMTVGELFVIKFGSISTLYGLAQLGKYLFNHGMLPQSFIDEINEEEDV